MILTRRVLVPMPGLVATVSLLCCCFSYGEKIHQDVKSSSGGRVQVVLQGHDDPGFLVNGIAFDSKGKRLPEDEFLGVAEDFALPGVRFALYEAQEGNLVGLYQEARPDVLLMVANFKERWTLSKLDRYAHPELAATAVNALARAAGHPLQWTDEPVVNWGSDSERPE